MSSNNFGSDIIPLSAGTSDLTKVSSNGEFFSVESGFNTDFIKTIKFIAIFCEKEQTKK